MKKWAIFDFDGTIANTIDLMYKYIDEIGAKVGWESLEIDDIKKIRDYDVMDIIAKLRITPLLMWRIKKNLKKEMPNVKSYAGIAALMANLKDKGVNTAIISSNSSDNIIGFLETNEITTVHSVHSEPNLTAKGKKIAKFLEENAISKEDAIYIGDEVRDVRAARDADVQVCSVTWGFNSEKRLLEEKPDYIANTVDELFEVITTK